ncbi:MAG TPA: HipA family kinase [Bryobacteraceae bacterium]|nr:HipA family kinase [Bryobacteraceae bacterium]
MPLNARRHIRKMRGGAQSHLIEADDGNYYVVKFLNNPQHRRILVNELIAGVFAQYLQIATPETAIISVSPGFVAENPEVSIQLGSRSIPVSPGWHFGSRFPGDPARVAVYDYLPDALLRQVANADHFLAVLVLDKWLSNADGRQSVYFRARIQDWDPRAAVHPRQLGFVACMIDQGFVFNGPNWEFVDAPLLGLAPRLAVYERVCSLESFQPWLDQVVGFPEHVVDKALSQVPAQWFDGDEEALERLLEQLMRRRARVPDLLLDCRRARIDLFPNWNG